MSIKAASVNLPYTWCGALWYFYVRTFENLRDITISDRKYDCVLQDNFQNFILALDKQRFLQYTAKIPNYAKLKIDSIFYKNETHVVSTEDITV